MSEKTETTLAVLDEAVRGPTGLQAVVHELRAEVAELQKFRSTVVGVQLAVGILSPILAHYLFGLPVLHP